MHSILLALLFMGSLKNYYNNFNNILKQHQFRSRNNVKTTI